MEQNLTDDAASVPAEGGWRSHPINIRITLPFMRQRYYLTLVAGSDRRSGERVREERIRNPLRTLNNLLFVGGILGLVYMIGIFGLFFYMKILEM